MRRSALILPALLLLVSAAPAGGEEPLRLGDVNLGEQVCGPTLSLHDLAGRVVLVYHWCVSCPMSTGAFPFVNDLVRRYGDRGLAVVGFHVRRNPEVEENDVVWYLEHLAPAFPVVRLGWTCEWPQAWLPWAVLFDHEGREIWRGGLQEIEPLVEKALDAAPDPLCGGPYDRLREAAARIAADRAHAGRHLPEIRRLAADHGSDTAARAEAHALIVHVHRWFAGQVEKALRDADGPVEQARVLRDLAEMFEGDELGAGARELLAVVVEAPGHAAEEEAWTALVTARTAFRRLPPPGRYVYHPTEMIYETLADPALLDRRARIHAVFREELDRIRRSFPETYAAEVAGDLLFRYDPPEIPAAAAEGRLALAARLTEEGARPADLAEGALLLREVAEGRPAGDEIGARAASALADLVRKRGAELTAARAALVALEAAAEAVEAEIRAGGSLFPQERAEECLRRLDAIAARAGPGSELARRISGTAAAVRRSYEGPAWLGVAFAAGHEGPGLRIGRVDEGSGAAAARLRAGDVLLAVDGEEIAGAEGLRAMLGKRRPGDIVALTVERRSAPDAAPETIETSTRLGRRP